MQIGGQEIDEGVIVRIQRTIDENPCLSRTALSRRICKEMKWQSRNGRLKEVSCRKALVKLHRAGALRLAEARPFGGRAKGRTEEIEPEPVIKCRLREIQPVELIRIDQADRKASRVWNELMDRYHYLGAGPLCGAQLRYLIRSETHGWLGGLAFSAAAWRVQARDRWIGWSPEIRERNLHQVVCNSRFLILPHLEVPHLASHVLGLALQRLGQDFRGRYGYEPLLVETYIEKGRFAGTCYRAANFIEVGQTQGRGRQDRSHRGGTSIKGVFVYALHKQARQRLSEGRTLHSAASPARVARDWSEEEFGGAPLSDRRLKQRLLGIARDFYARPQAQIPQACQSRAKTKAAYRFFKHREAKMEILLEAHHQSTYRRIANERVVLCPQDTTSLNYNTHRATEGLGTIGSVRADGVLGLLVHDTMAFSVQGTPLGLLDVQCWARDQAEFGKSHKRKQRPIEQKESFKWLRSFQRVAEAQRQCPDTMLVSIGDREADVYELFELALADPHAPKLLVRAEQDRLLTQGQDKLWAAVTSQPLAGIQELHVPRSQSSPARQAQLEVRFAKVTLKPPARDGSKLDPLTLWAVLAQEVGPPQDVEPLSWMLLTTLPVGDLQQAVEKIDWYTKRWGIEIFHKTLKSGCKVEERQLGDASSIQACLAIDMVVAWRVYHLAKLGRETPDIPCTVFFEDAEWKALLTMITKVPVIEGQPPTLRDAMRKVASFGGFLGRKCDGEPGTKSLWLGLQRLDDFTLAWKVLVPHLKTPPRVQPSRYG